MAADTFSKRRRAGKLPALRAAQITCPECRRVAREPMPPAACLYFFQCPGCGELLAPKTGDCCVFCSYGDRPCQYAARKD